VPSFSNAAKNQNSSSLEALGTRIAAGVVQKMHKVRARLPAHFVDAAPRGNPRFRTFALMTMEGEFRRHILHGS
jgi:hypothetical protein